jgi:CheY-like chemotaxis protein/signal transduction histidine kinase/integral membrane sensor domain MASE1
VLPGVTQKENEIIPSIMRQLWVFLAYVAAARLAIHLALPPGYASPIWPAAGLAIAAVIVWGPSLTIAIFLGSIACNLRPDELLQNPTDQIIIQLCLALGTSIQAYLGSLLFHALDRRLPNSADPRRLSLEVLLLGPVACLTAATIGIAALTVFHVIDMRMFLSNWTSWWLGDSFGAGVITPLLVRLYRILPSKPQRLRVMPYLLIPAGLSLIIVATLVIHLNNNNRRNQKALEHSVDDFHQHMQANVQRLQQDLTNLVEYSKNLEPLQVMERYQAMQGKGPQLLWVPRVPEERRAEFEGALGNAHQNFTILEKTTTGHLAPAAARPVHWPLVIRSNHEENLLPPGFDLGSLPDVDALLQKAWNTSALLSSSLLNLGPNKKAVFLVQRSQEGLVLALLSMDQLLQPVLAELNHPVFHLKIEAQDQTPSAAFTSWFGLSAPESQTARAYGHYQKTLVLGSQNLILQVGFPAAAFHGGRMGDPMFVTFLCMLLAFTLNVLVIAQQHVPSVVDPQTKMQQDEFRIQYEALREADRSKSLLLGNISHQIRSPLQGVLGLLDMLRGSSLDPKQRSSIDTIIANCHSMRLMLEDVQTYAHMEIGQLTLAADDFLMDDCLRDLISVYEIAAEERHNEFKIKNELPTNLRVQGDRRRFHRVLSHLLGDAIRRTQKGRLSLHAMLESNGSLFFSIESQRNPQDDIHDNEWEFGNVKTWQPLEIFNLKICERIVQAMGGRLSLERPGPLVSRVTLSLPLPLTLPESPDPVSLEAQFQDVLVVDDNVINLTVASGLLTKLGYTVETAANGHEALEKVKKKKYDVIFMDCQMPVMDGYKATEHIRAFYSPERGPLMIALTANAMEEARDKALQSGMDQLIVKPVSSDILIRTIGYARTRPAEIPATAPAAPIMDFKAFSMGLGDDSDLIETAIQRYFEEIDGMMLRLRSEVERADAPSVGKTAHTLKGMSSLFAAHALVEANRNLEMAGKEGRLEEFIALLKRVENLTELLKTELKKLMDDRSPSRKDVA